MNRRSFLRTLALSAGGIALVGPELLVPKRTYFLPPAGGWAVGDVGWQMWRWGVTPAFPELLKGDLMIVDWHDVPVGRHMLYQNFYSGNRPAFVSIQNDEWKPMGELT
jgi:hypothetical protein